MYGFKVSTSLLLLAYVFDFTALWALSGPRRHRKVIGENEITMWSLKEALEVPHPHLCL